MEYWDAYDENMNLIEGMTLTRGETVPDGVFHLVCDIFLEHEDGTILIMQRDPSKEYGSLWEATAGGSALKGESPLECAQRELYEETGIRGRDLGLTASTPSSQPSLTVIKLPSGCRKTKRSLSAGSQRKSSRSLRMQDSSLSAHAAASAKYFMNESAMYHMTFFLYSSSVSNCNASSLFPVSVSKMFFSAARIALYLTLLSNRFTRKSASTRIR